MKTRRSFAVTGTFICAVIWGMMTTLMPLLEIWLWQEPAEYVAGEIAAASETMISGAIVVALGLGVFWKKAWAAWLLCGYAIFDLIYGLSQPRVILTDHVPQLVALTTEIERGAGYLLPFILFFFALFAATSLKSVRQATNPSESIS
jgi:hypothetical protein